MNTIFRKMHASATERNETARGLIWIALFLAFTVCCIYVILTIVDGSGPSMDYCVYLMGRRVDGVLGCMLAFSLYLLWKYHKKEKKLPLKSIFLGTAVIAISYMDQMRFSEWIFLYFFVALVVQLFLMGCLVTLIWALTLPVRKKPGVFKWVREIVWFLCLGAAFILANIFVATTPYRFSGNLHQTLALCLPLIYPFVFNYLKDHIRSEKRSLLKISAAYFGACTAFYMISIILLLIVKNPLGNRSLGMAVYYVLMGSIVYVLETKALRKAKGLEGGKALVLLMVLYIVVCISATFLTNWRAREVLCGIGDKIVNASQDGEADWLGYRKAAIQSFWAGNTDLLDKMDGMDEMDLTVDYGDDILALEMPDDWGIPPGSHMITTYGGYHRFSNITKWGELLFRKGRWYLCLFICLITAVAAVLFCVKLENPFLNRCKNYLAISYLIRLVQGVFYIMGMFIYCEVDMPFTSFAMMDFVILAVFSRRVFY